MNQINPAADIDCGDSMHAKKNRTISDLMVQFYTVLKRPVFKYFVPQRNNVIH